jgi:hypothetical protein
VIERILHPSIVEAAVRAILPDADERRDIHGLGKMLVDGLAAGRDVFR